MEKKKEMSGERKFLIWLRCTAFAMIIHAAILVIVFATTSDWNPTTSKIVWLTESFGEGITTTFLFPVSHWLDVLIWPIWLGALVPLLTSKHAQNDKDVIIGLVVGLVVGLIFGPVFGPLIGLISILAISLVLGLAFSLVIDRPSVLSASAVTGLATSLVCGLVFGLSAGLVTSLVFGLGIGLGKLIKRLFYKPTWTTIGRWLIARDINGNPA